MTLQNAFERLMRVGGLPEPFLQDDEREARRWRNASFDRKPPWRLSLFFDETGTP